MTLKLRTITISDIHGCIEEFDEMLIKLQYNKQTDRIILLGDLVDRGPDSNGVVRKARELNLECVMGNHEQKFLKWLNSNKKLYDTKPHYSKFSDEDIDYIFRMPTYIKVENTIVVHAGLRAGISLSNQSKNDMTHIRYIGPDGDLIGLRKVTKFGKENLKAHFWTEYWKGPESVVYGHSVHSYEQPFIEEVAPGINCIGTDTGCVFGGHLTAYILETKEIVQVKAKQMYFQPGF